MLKLVVDTETQSTSVPIRWCVDEGTGRKLQERKALKPHLLLVVTQGGSEVSRRIIPIDHMMEYVDFPRPGDYKILATVVWNSKGSAEILRKRIFGGVIVNEDGQKERFADEAVLFYEGNLKLYDNRRYSFDHELALRYLDEEASVEVNLAKEFFAKPPSRFEAFWVNFWFERPALNRCQFRKRRPLAYFVQPFFVLPYMVGKTLFRAVAALFLLLCGIRGVNLRPILHPWAMDSIDIWFCSGQSIFTTTKLGGERQIIIAFFMPVIHVIIGISAFGATYIPAPKPPNFWRLVIEGEVIAVAIFGLLYLIIATDWARRLVIGTTKGIGPKICSVLSLLVFAAIVFHFFVSFPKTVAVITILIGVIWLTNRLLGRGGRKLAALPTEERERVLLEHERASYQAIACDGPMEAKLDALPKERRTIYLRYRELKAKVCKSFAS